MALAAWMICAFLGSQQRLLDQPVPASKPAQAAAPLSFVIRQVQSGASDPKLRTFKLGKHDLHVKAYRDQKNYVGYYVREMGARDYPLSEPTAVAVIGGKVRSFGPGSPAKVWGLTHFLVTIPVDDRNVPSGAEFATGSFLRVYKGQEIHDIGRWSFVGSPAPDALVLSRGNTVAYWKSGRFQQIWTLSKKWQPVRANSRGEVLLRLSSEADEEPEAGADPELTSEVRWDAALLSNGKVHELRFDKPKNSKGLLWRDTDSFGRDRRILFSAFYGDVFRHYELRPKP